MRISCINSITWTWILKTKPFPQLLSLPTTSSPPLFRQGSLDSIISRKTRLKKKKHPEAHRSAIHRCFTRKFGIFFRFFLDVPPPWSDFSKLLIRKNTTFLWMIESYKMDDWKIWTVGQSCSRHQDFCQLKKQLNSSTWPISISSLFPLQKLSKVLSTQSIWLDEFLQILVQNSEYYLKNNMYHL